MSVEDGLLSPGKLSDLTGLSPGRLRSAARRGEIPFREGPANRILFEPVAALAAISRWTAVRGDTHTRAPLPDLVERVYIAGASSELVRVDAFISKVKGMGIGITFDWPEAVCASARKDEVAAELDERISPRCLAGVAAGDLVVALHPIAPGTTIGAWVEMGAALALRKPVVLISPEAIPFAALTHHVRTKRAALDLLRERAPKGGSK